MILERGNMWDVFGHTGMFYITTNPIVNKDGLAVMGRGIALEAANKFPTIRKDFADKLTHLQRGEPMRYTGYIGRYEDQAVGYFMVKNHWKAPARLDLIDLSCRSLIAANMGRGIPGGYMYSVRIDLNFPGIGNGGLKREDVLPVLMQLPDNVHVWEYG